MAARAASTSTMARVVVQARRRELDQPTADDPDVQEAAKMARADLVKQYRGAMRWLAARGHNDRKRTRYFR